MKLICIILIIIGIPLTILWMCSLFWMLTPFRPCKKLCHDILGWHDPDPNEERWSDGCSDHCHCRYCGKEIMMDSQGNWF